MVRWNSFGIEKFSAKFTNHLALSCDTKFNKLLQPRHDVNIHQNTYLSIATIHSSYAHV